MCQLDERILEHLSDEPWSSPEVMGSLVGFQYASKGRLAERCRILARVGFIAPLHADAYEITGLGQRYLNGEDTPEEIATSYDISVAEVHAALAYAFSHPEEMRDIDARNQSLYEEQAANRLVPDETR